MAPTNSAGLGAFVCFFALLAYLPQISNFYNKNERHAGALPQEVLVRAACVLLLMLSLLCAAGVLPESAYGPNHRITRRGIHLLQCAFVYIYIYFFWLSHRIPLVTRQFSYFAAALTARLCRTYRFIVNFMRAQQVGLRLRLLIKR